MTKSAGGTERRRLVWPYVWIVDTAGIGILLFSIARVFATALHPLAIVLALLATFSGLMVLRLRSISASFSLGDAFTLSALFLFGPEFGALAVALDTIAMSFRLGGAPHRIVFNTAALALAMWAAGQIAFGVLGLPLPALAADIPAMVLSSAVCVVLFFLLNSGLVAAAVALEQGLSISAVWREHFAGLWVSPAAGGYVGLLVALLIGKAGAMAALTLLPLPLIVYQMFRTSLARTDDQMRHLEEMNRTYASTIEAFAAAVDAKDQVTHGHLRRVQVYVLGVARELGLDDPATVRALEAAALLHDVGKIGVPEHILNKPGKLTVAEFEEMKKHVTIGVEILSAVEFPFPVIPVVRHHHENWDGTGYPDGISGEEIPIGARILSVVDCFDALTSDRPYRAAMSRDEAFAILRERRGRMYDPAIVDLFLAVQDKLAAAAGLEMVADSPTPITAPRLSESRRRAEPIAQIAAADPLARLLGDLLGDCLCVIYELDSKGSALTAQVARGPFAKDVIGHQLEIGRGVSGWACAHYAAVDDTDAVLDLGSVLPAESVSGLSCTSVPVKVGGRPAVMTVYGPRSEAVQRLAVVHSVSRYLQGARSGTPVASPVAMAS